MRLIKLCLLVCVLFVAQSMLIAMSNEDFLRAEEDFLRAYENPTSPFWRPSMREIDRYYRILKIQERRQIFFKNYEEPKKRREIRRAKVLVIALECLAKRNGETGGNGIGTNKPFNVISLLSRELLAEVQEFATCDVPGYEGRGLSSERLNIEYAAEQRNKQEEQH